MTLTWTLGATLEIFCEDMGATLTGRVGTLLLDAGSSSSWEGGVRGSDEAGEDDSEWEGEGGEDSGDG